MRQFFFFIIIGFVFGCGNERPTPDLLISHADEAYEDLTLADASPQKIEYLIVHCSWTDPKYHWSADRLRGFFKNEKKWTRYGYHEYILYSGFTETLTPIDEDEYLSPDELTYNASGYNSKSIAICLEGGGEYRNGKMYDKLNFSLQQRTALKQRIEFYRCRYPNIKVIPHNLVNKSKSCPIIDIEKL